MMPRVVGVDFGTKRIGVAVCDPLQTFAQPVGTYARDQSIDVIAGIAERDGVGTIVVGWPLDSDGNENVMTQRVDTYIDTLAERLGHEGRSVQFVRWDERGSSREAVSELLRAGAPRKQRGRGGARDRVAAALILQEYLDERNAEPGGA